MPQAWRTAIAPFPEKGDGRIVYFLWLATLPPRSGDKAGKP